MNMTQRSRSNAAFLKKIYIETDQPKTHFKAAQEYLIGQTITSDDINAIRVLEDDQLVKNSFERAST